MNYHCYYSLTESGMALDLQIARPSMRSIFPVEQGTSVGPQPFVDPFKRLLSRPWPYYTLPELEHLAHWLEQVSPPHTSAARLRQEEIALKLAALRQQEHAGTLSQRAVMFRSFPGIAAWQTRHQPHLLVFPPDVRILHHTGVKYYACPRENQLLRVDHYLQGSLVTDARERLLVMQQAREMPPYLLAPRIRQMVTVAERFAFPSVPLALPTVHPAPQHSDPLFEETFRQQSA